MAWTAPMTAVVGDVWTSAQFNTHIRDNLLETFPGKATAAGRVYVTTALNAVAERVPSTAVVLTQEDTTSTAYADLTTVGPAVTVTTGTTAIVFVNCQLRHGTANGQASASVAVSGATTKAASDDYRILMSGAPASKWIRTGICRRFTGLTVGSNTFTMKYRVAAGTGTFVRRELIVLPL